MGLGIESGSQHVRDGVEKGRFGERDIIVTVDKIRSHGIHVAANYIFGLPDDTMDSMRATLDLALALNTEWANFYCAMAYPGISPVRTRETETMGRCRTMREGPAGSAIRSMPTTRCPLPTESLTAAQVLAFRDRAFQEYFEQRELPEHAAQRTFGARVAVHVKEMCGHHVRRRHHDAVGNAGCLTAESRSSS